MVINSSIWLSSINTGAEHVFVISDSGFYICLAIYLAWYVTAVTLTFFINFLALNFHLCIQDFSDFFLLQQYVYNLLFALPITYFLMSQCSDCSQCHFRTWSCIKMTNSSRNCKENFCLSTKFCLGTFAQQDNSLILILC